MFGRGKKRPRLTTEEFEYRVDFDMSATAGDVGLGIPSEAFAYIPTRGQQIAATALSGAYGPAHERNIDFIGRALAGDVGDDERAALEATREEVRKSTYDLLGIDRSLPIP